MTEIFFLVIRDTTEIHMNSKSYYPYITSAHFLLFLSTHLKDASREKIALVLLTVLPDSYHLNLGYSTINFPYITLV